ncbi:MAG: ABC transporter permease [Aerococcus sp.]|nr:ABC transporter permease [Aerococcus sp.]
MFLAWNEIKHSKLRYFLVVGLMFLISYLVFFLVGLADGLAQENRTAVDKWDADNIILADGVNDNIRLSVLQLKDFDDVEADDKAALGQTQAVFAPKDGTEDAENDENIDGNLFGIDKDSFIAPNIVEGKMFDGDNQAVVDESMRAEHGFEIGDHLKMSNTAVELEIVGFTDNAKFSVAPVAYISIPTYQQIRFEHKDDSENGPISAVVVRGSVKGTGDDVDTVPISDFIQSLPGYSAQNMTFGFMIGFLVVIVAIVISIFIYVLTIQKMDIFGVMKAQGISTWYISKSVVAQTFILVVVGVVLGLVLTLGTALILPAAVPFYLNLWFALAVSVIMIIFAIIGALFSVRAVVKVDPLDAIG